MLIKLSGACRTGMSLYREGLRCIDRACMREPRTRKESGVGRQDSSEVLTVGIYREICSFYEIHMVASRQAAGAE